MPNPHDTPPLPDDHDAADPLDRIDVDPPYGSTVPDKVKRFRDLLAELIARQALAEGRGDTDSDNKTNP